MKPFVDLNTLPLPELFASLTADGLVRRLLELARDEDLGPGGSPGDITTLAWGHPERQARARLVLREDAVVAGLAAAPMLIQVMAPGVQFEALSCDGEALPRGRSLAELSGPLGEMLALERTMLNLLSRLSGVATLTATYIEEMNRGSPPVRAELLDTRKTTPGLRRLEKYAVRCGGGRCHRLGLYDAVLIKDNHLAANDPPAWERRIVDAAARARADRTLRFIEVEADTLEQFTRLLALPSGTIDFTLLDNMTIDQLSRAVAMRDAARSTIVLEASGGVTLATIREIAETGIERISVGALTHSAKSVDIGLDIVD